MLSLALTSNSSTVTERHQTTLSVIIVQYSLQPDRVSVCSSNIAIWDFGILNLYLSGIQGSKKII